MNYCRKCQSDYEKPGTCNCFAGQQEAQPVAAFKTTWVQCPHCWHWFSGSHLCYAHVETRTVGSINIEGTSLTPYQIYDHVREEAARRYRPEGVHVPPLKS